MTTYENFLERRPANREDLRELVGREFGVWIPSRAVCPHHQSPLAYLEESFFGQEDLLVWANRGGGKTMLAAIATVLDAVYKAPCSIRVLGGSFDQSDRLAEYVRELLADHPELVAGRQTRQRVRVQGGSDIRMLAQSQRAVRGQHVQKIRCDEVDLFDNEVWRAVQFSTRSKKTTRGSIEVLSTLHRSGGLMQSLVDQAGSLRGRDGRGYRLVNWCLWEVIEKCPPQRLCAGCQLEDDCRGLARGAEGFFSIEDAIAIKTRSSRAAWESEMLCRGAQRDWLVLPEFDPTRHVVIREGQQGGTLYRAIDFGYRSPFVCLWIELLPDGQVHVLDEYVRRQVALAGHVREILKRDPGPVAMTYVDPAGRQRESTSGKACTEMLAAAGIACNARASTIVEGLELIRAHLCPAGGVKLPDGTIRPLLTVHPRCKHLIHALLNYHYPPPESRLDAEAPVKDGPDHLVDALRYFFVNRMRPQIAISRGTY